MSSRCEGQIIKFWVCLNGAGLYKSGKEAASRLPPPLRTVRASFPAYGSSLHNRTFYRAG